MIPSRRLAIVFLATLLSTRHLSASSELQASTDSRVNHEARDNGQVAGNERQQEADTNRTRPSIGITDHDDCRDKQAARQQYPADGSTSLPATVDLSWSDPGKSSSFNVYYTVGGGNAKEDLAGTTDKTHLRVTFPQGPVKWRVETVFDKGCSLMSGAATFTVGAVCVPPVIAIQPASLTINDGQTATLAVVAAGTNLSYQWFEGVSGDRIKPVGNDLPAYQTPVLHSTTKYWVAVYNSCGVLASLAATVGVTPVCVAPAITSNSPALSLLIGQPATLAVTATGSGPLGYQWYEGMPGTRTKPVGINSPAFTSPPLTASTGYWVEVTNGCGAARSAYMPATVTASCTAPAIASVSPSSTVTNGETATLTASATGTAPLAFQWFRGTAGDRSNPAAGSATFTTSPLVASSSYWVEVTNSCGAAQSGTVTITVGNVACAPVALAVPQLDLVGQVSSGVPYNVQWSAVAGATSYEMQEGADLTFAAAETIPSIATSLVRQHSVSSSTAFFYRVRALGACNSIGAWSSAARVVVLAAEAANKGSVDLIAPFGTETPIVAETEIVLPPVAGKSGVNDNGSVTVGSSQPWLDVKVTGMTQNGVQTTVTINPATLPNGTSTATVKATGSNGVTTSVPVSISLVTPVTATPRGAVSADTVIIPAVAHADGANSKWQSDVRIAHLYDSPVNYAVTFTPSRTNGMAVGQQTTVLVPAGQTIALNDIVQKWFGSGALSDGATGLLEVRAIDAPRGQGALTFVSSRLYNATPGGTYGQFIPAIPLSQFMGNQPDASLALTQLAQSTSYRTNIGLVEGDGAPASVTLSGFDAEGRQLFQDLVTLLPGEHRQFDGLLAQHGVTANNIRVNVAVTSSGGKVSAYASVIDNSSGDPSFVPAAASTTLGSTRYVVPGVADLATATGRWRTDMRIFNPNPAAVDALLELYPIGATEPSAVRSLSIAPGAVTAIDDSMQSMFGTTNAGGAIHITTATMTSLVATARTYHYRPDGTFGQFIPGVAAESAAGIGDRALQMLQLEESANFRTNLGLAETSGHPVSLEVRAILPGSKVSSSIQVDLGAHEFRQLNQVLRSMGMTEGYNARISVKVIGGDGRVTGYGSVIDNRTQDPTYVAAQ
jgi:Ig-like domain CHU_C associated